MTWRLAQVARDGTHHEIDGRPLYAERFDDVLTFHAPGLAPVRRDRDAWHIHPSGRAAYDQRFVRTFGFYDGAAAVITKTGWHHIRPDGSALYPMRYAWCGNFQDGRCTVRQYDGSYLHLSRQGRPAYPQRWRYAGDFSSGIAVIQNDDGRSTHIDQDGVSIHGYRYLDLDVFHKGYARARDEAGWMHIGLNGRPVYARRFAMVEPFYNGQARVERPDGGLEVIDETGQRLVELRPTLRSEFAALSADMVGYWKTGTLCAGVETGLFEVLPATSEIVAQQCQLSQDGALRLLHALMELGLVQETDGAWDVTLRGAYLQSRHPLTLADAAIEYGRRLTSTWTNLPKALGTDSDWRAPEIFQDVAGDTARLVSHHRMLQSYARHDYMLLPAALGLGNMTRVLDAGGGTGSLAQGLIAHYPHLEVTVLDLPQVIDHARLLRRATRRLTWFGADLFEPWHVQVDAVLLSRVLHDWDDRAALRLLQNARRALPAGGRLFIVEMLLSEHGADGSLCDLHLLMTTGGRERTLTDYQALLEWADFDYVEVRRLPALPAIIIGAAR